MIHELSDVKSENIGEGTDIWQFSVVLKGAVIGKYCNLNCHTFVEGNVVIGDNVTLKSGVYLWNGIRVHDNVFIGPNVSFVNDLYPRSKQQLSNYTGSILEYGCSIGANATIMLNANIGKYALIGAGSLVTKNVGDYELWYGQPAVHKGYVSEEGEVLSLEFKNKKTGKIDLDFKKKILK